ncbi:MAG: response regulator transcription factor [Opitutaceae bacterium]|nr:response regulator transcription factor [Opitutaceae bacterium]
MSTAIPRPIRLLIVDDSPLIRAGLRAVLEDHAGVTIVGEAGTAAEGLAAVMQSKPDVVLLDLRLPDKPGLSACRDILQRRPGTRVLILTSSTDEQNVHEAVAVGAHGYLLKENDGASLVSAITRVAAGHSVLDPSLADQVLRLMKRHPEPADRLASLSGQERRVLALLAEGLTNKGIGERLGLTEKTVKNYLSNIFDKLHLANRAQAAALYAQQSPARAGDR